MTQVQTYLECIYTLSAIPWLSALFFLTSLGAFNRLIDALTYRNFVSFPAKTAPLLSAVATGAYSFVISLPHMPQDVQRVAIYVTQSILT